MAVHHIRQMLQLTNTTEIVAICEPSPASYDRASRVFTAAGLEPPPNLPDIDQLLDGFAGKLDAAFIMTPHAYHHDQTRKCMEAGADVLLKSPWS
jgi:predicted dehydrogenase